MVSDVVKESFVLVLEAFAYVAEVLPEHRVKASNVTVSSFFVCFKIMPPLFCISHIITQEIEGVQSLEMERKSKKYQNDGKT